MQTEDKTEGLLRFSCAVAWMTGGHPACKNTCVSCSWRFYSRRDVQREPVRQLTNLGSRGKWLLKRRW